MGGDGSGGGDGGGPDEWGDHPLLHRYVLVDRIPVRAHFHCFQEWIMRELRPDHCGAANVGRSDVGRLSVSTVFLGEDKNYTRAFKDDPDPGPPLFFETMTFAYGDEGKELGASRQLRCSTWLEAEAQHAREVKVAHVITYPDRYPPGELELCDADPLSDALVKLAREHLSPEALREFFKACDDDAGVP
jgi:hypothetical protein